MSTPGTHHLGPRVAAFDDAADRALESRRGNAVADAVFTTASHLGDWSLLWHLVGAARGITSDRRAEQAIVFSALLGAESLIVNQGIKRLFRRDRPTTSGDDRYSVRTPSTSSFPSGHASAAAFAATVLTTWSPKAAPVWWGLAGVVATSRAWVRIHHASDVVAGAAVGLALGAAASPLVKRLR